MRVATLNVQNLRLEAGGGNGRLHGAWDTDAPEDAELDPIDRKLTAELLADVDADVVALQEVFDQKTLDYFHQEFLLPTGTSPYPYRICLPGNDGRGLDVALMSRRPVATVKSHAATTLNDLDLDPPEGVEGNLPIFRRDCLLVTVEPLTLAVCHFKSPYPDEARAWMLRRMEALATRRLLERTMKSVEQDLWLILGDLNEPGASVAANGSAISPLKDDFGIDLMLRLHETERWTYYDPHSGRYHCPDAMLASPALAIKYPKVTPSVVRKGLGVEVSRFRGARLGSVGEHRPHASDHAAVVIDFPGL